MIVVLLIAIIILLSPGGVDFLAKLYSIFASLVLLAFVYWRYGITTYWVIGAFGFTNPDLPSAITESEAC